MTELFSEDFNKIMATVDKDINEQSKKIEKVKRIVRKRAENLEEKDLKQTELSDGPLWKEMEFSHPERFVRIGTLFSGIGAFEHALNQLDIKHKYNSHVIVAKENYL